MFCGVGSPYRGELQQNCSGRHSRSDTDEDFLQLETYGFSLVDESAYSALQFRVPPQVYSNRLSEAVSGDVIKKLNLPREESVILPKASESIITAISII